jgi:plastocyanin
MNKTGKVVLALVVVAIIAVAAVVLANMYKPANNSSTTNSNNTSTSEKQETKQPSSEPTVTITYDGNGFSLSANTIKSGETVKVVNSSDKDLVFDSNPHPVHTDNPELNVGDIPAGESKSFALTTKGEWGFHNHLDSSQHGSLTVE